MDKSERNRCGWCGDDPLYVHYHDKHWGVPVFDDRLLFEMLSLEGAQAGLSWLTILRKRGAYIRAFDNFDVDVISQFTDDDVDRLLADDGIVRNRLKIESVIKNSRVIKDIQKEFGSFSSYLWDYVNGKPVQNEWKALDKVPAQTSVSQKISKDLKRRGCNFVGPTICYAYMQSIGMVNDHLVSCFRYEEVRAMAEMIKV